MGVTKRSLKIEYLRWLTERGAAPRNGKPVKGKNRPVLRWPNDSLIKESEAVKQLKGKILMNVSSNHSKYDIKTVFCSQG